MISKWISVTNAIIESLPSVPKTQVASLYLLRHCVSSNCLHYCDRKALFYMWCNVFVDVNNTNSDISYEQRCNRRNDAFPTQSTTTLATESWNLSYKTIIVVRVMHIAHTQGTKSTKGSLTVWTMEVRSRHSLKCRFMNRFTRRLFSSWKTSELYENTKLLGWKYSVSCPG